MILEDFLIIHLDELWEAHDPDKLINIFGKDEMEPIRFKDLKKFLETGFVELEFPDAEKKAVQFPINPSYSDNIRAALGDKAENDEVFNKVLLNKLRLDTVTLSKFFKSTINAYQGKINAENAAAYVKMVLNDKIKAPKKPLFSFNLD